MLKNFHFDFLQKNVIYRSPSSCFSWSRLPTTPSTCRSLFNLFRLFSTSLVPPELFSDRFRNVNSIFFSSRKKQYHRKQTRDPIFFIIAQGDHGCLQPLNWKDRKSPKWCSNADCTGNCMGFYLRRGKEGKEQICWQQGINYLLLLQKFEKGCRYSARSVCARACLGLLAPQRTGRYREESSQGKFCGFTNINRYDKLPNTFNRKFLFSWLEVFTIFFLCV